VLDSEKEEVIDRVGVNVGERETVRVPVCVGDIVNEIDGVNVIVGVNVIDSDGDTDVVCVSVCVVGNVMENVSVEESDGDVVCVDEDV
jgi:hypothetical protein